MVSKKKPAAAKRAAAKRANPPRACDYTKAFVKDWKRLSQGGRHDMPRLKQALLLLVGNDSPLTPEWLDHPLKGEWADHRECHIRGDFLLIYLLHGDTVLFVRAGSHADLFEK